MKLAKKAHSLAGAVVKRKEKKRKWPKFGRKMAKKGRKRLDEAPVSIVYTSHFVRKMVENCT